MKPENKPTNWKYWEDNFYKAKRFFETKGHTKTRSKYKKLWYNSFNEIFKEIERLRKRGDFFIEEHRKVVEKCTELKKENQQLRDELLKFRALRKARGY